MTDHRKIALEYCQVWQTNDEPWLEFELQFMGLWQTCSEFANPIVFHGTGKPLFRRKPKTITVMNEHFFKVWKGTLSRRDALIILDKATDKDDPYWDNVVEDFYNEADDTMPTIYDVFAALGVTEDEYKDATGAKKYSVYHMPSRDKGD